MLTATPRRSSWVTDEVQMLRETAREFFRARVVPNHERWAEQQHVDREVWNKAGELGLLCPSIPEEYGGGGGTFAHEAVLIEEQAARVDRASAPASTAHRRPLHLDYGNEEQKRRWLPRHGDAASWSPRIAMTEPGTGSDLQAIKTTALRDGDEYVINGAKTFITNGQHCDLVIVAAKTDPDGRRRGRLADRASRPDRAAASRRGRVPGEDRHARPGHRRAVLRGRPGARVATCSARTRARASSS